MNPYILLLIGLFSGVVSGLLGVGGGIIMVPAMTLLAKVPVKVAVGTSLAVIIPTAMVGTFKHHQQGNVDWRIAAYLGATAIIGGWIGSWLIAYISPETLKRSFGVVIILVGLRLLLNR